MSRESTQVQKWAEEAPRGISRWPGAAVRNSKNDIDFRRGVAIHVTDLAISIETELHTLVKLMGESYAHYCENCQATIPGNVTYRRSAGTIVHNGIEIPIRYFCPYCGPDHMLRCLRAGEKMRLHYRFEADRTSGGWFGEVFAW